MELAMVEEPEVAKDGEDEDLKPVLFDPKQPADEVMTSFQIALAYKEMAKMAEEDCDRPDIALAFRMAMFRTLEDFYLRIMDEQSAIVKKQMFELAKDEARGLDEKYKRVNTMWKTMEDAARMVPCFICYKLLLPEKLESHLADKHPKRDPLALDEIGIARRDPPLESQEWNNLFVPQARPRPRSARRRVRQAMPTE